MRELSNMQRKIYDYIASCIHGQGYPPSVREIGEAVGLKSPSTVHFHLKRLEEAGMIEKGAGKGRAITLRETAPLENQVPVVGNVAAGSPILAEECVEDYLTFDTGGRDCYNKRGVWRERAFGRRPRAPFHFFSGRGPVQIGTRRST